MKLALSVVACMVLLFASCSVLYRSTMIGTLVCGGSSANAERCAANRRTFVVSLVGVGVASVTPAVILLVTFLKRRRAGTTTRAA
jgi:hypothetical protein